MRITGRLLSDNFLADMQRNLQNLSKIQEQASSTKKFSRPSDDPTNVQIAMQMQTAIDANNQYGTNIKTAETWMDTTDTALDQLGTVISKIRNELVQSGNGAYKQDEQTKVNDAVKQQVTQIAQILNTNFKGEYIFGGTQGLAKPVTTSTDKGNVIIDYADKDGNAVKKVPDVVSNGFSISNWNGKSITFDVNGTSKTLNLDTSDTNIDTVIKDLNKQIQDPSNLDLRDKINVVKTNDGNVKFLAVNDSDNITMTATGVSDLSSVSGKQLSSMTIANIGADKNIEVSQGVVLTYNATASNVMQYGDSTDSTTGDNISALMNRVQHHLSGQVLEKDASGNYVKDANGNCVWKDDADEARKQLIGQDLIDMDAASNKALKVRSEVGAKNSRMQDLESQNSTSKLNMTEVLSKTEDIDITQTTIEYYTAITTYQACLQVSAKVIQPTLMDYIH